MSELAPDQYFVSRNKNTSTPLLDVAIMAGSNSASFPHHGTDSVPLLAPHLARRLISAGEVYLAVSLGFYLMLGAMSRGWISPYLIQVFQSPLQK